MSFFDKLSDKFTGKKSGDDDNKNKSKKNNNNNNNPFANVGKAFANVGGGPKTFHGSGKSLGGSKPGKLIHVELSQPGPLGMKIERRPNSERTAIIAMVVPGGQAEAAGLQRGDIVCLAGSQGQEEIMYDLFIDMAASPQRPLVFDVRRIETKNAVAGSSASTGKTNASAEEYNRKQAVIAAAEAREKAARARDKPIKKTAAPKITDTDVNASIPNTPQSEEARRAVEAVKKGEHQLAAQLGYNPYETNKSTAGQARNATVATKHGSVDAGASSSTSTGGPGLPAVAPPREPLAEEDAPQVSPAFEQAYEVLVTTNDHVVVVSSFGILRKLLTNATSKPDEKFRRVRLSNPKIRAAITDVNGALELMMACGFELVEGVDGEDTLVFPPDAAGPVWLHRALHQMEQYENS